MNSVINITREDLLTELKIAKSNIIKDETDAKQNITQYFSRLREIMNAYEY
jgi:hypothetical protein